MIPRLKPYFSGKEIISFLHAGLSSVARFEKAFALQFQCSDAIAFPYGRSALWAFFKALDIEGKEIIQPAYTCSVVAHATVLSQNIPVFVDNNLYDYNMQIDAIRNAVTPQTHAIIPTHLYGYPMDIDTIRTIVEEAEEKVGHKIWIIQDCAHSFSAAYGGRSVINAGDCALFGLGISKLISSIFGGMITFEDQTLARKVRAFRDAQFYSGHWLKTLKRFAYLLALYPAFNDTFYGFVYWLQESTPFLNRLTKAFHLDEEIRFPPDYLDCMLPSEAEVGMTQLGKYAAIIRRRRQIAQNYHESLKVPQGWKLPPLVDGATYSHYAIRVPEREKTIRILASHGIQAGRVIEYSIPHLKGYQSFVVGSDFPNAYLCSESMINLPIHPSLNDGQVERIIETVNTLK
ncbi:MAG: hypothetical protein GYA18_02765 [Chloroflexi bacterium]|nr:hypothetical protein [Chloroflexota bacterium]